jgi:LL-diaminopimelate aminotransferase
VIQEANRLRQLPPYLFARIEEKIAEAKKKGIDIISLGIGDPDQPTFQPVIDALCQSVQRPANHRYPSSVGMMEYREAVARWYKLRFGVELDPANEVISLIGSKEGIGHISFCYVDPGDINLVPDPGYPVYGIGTLLAGGEPYLLPLLPENNFLPKLEDIPGEIAKKAKIMFINYPNNPTGAVANKEFFAGAVCFAKEYDLIVCHDNAYSEMAYDGYLPNSFLEVSGAKDVGIEFGSLSKPYNMTGWRIGWAAGNPEVLKSLAKLKSNIDSGVFQAVQEAAIAALTGPQDGLSKLQSLYQHRRDIVVESLNKLGWNLEKPKASFYIWTPVPKGYTSAEFAELVLEKAGVVITPGNGYGAYGEGYFRISLTVNTERLIEAMHRMEKTVGQVEF